MKAMFLLRIFSSIFTENLVYNFIYVIWYCQPVIKKGY